MESDAPRKLPGSQVETALADLAELRIKDLSKMGMFWLSGFWFRGASVSERRVNCPPGGFDLMNTHHLWVSSPYPDSVLDQGPTRPCRSM